jgi:4-hydroxyphenylacetate 3-monooxygenase
MDNVFVPWEDVFIYRDPARVMSFFPGSGFVHGAMFQGCTRYAVKLDFISGLLAKALRCTGGDEARNNQVLLGEVIAWRHLFWALSDAMANNPQPWKGDALLPELQAGHAYRVFGPDSWPRIKDIVQKTVTSALIYLPSSVKDFANPEIDRYLRQYVRGSHDIDHVERIKLMKLLWDSVGTEFAGRHELYERNYSGGWEDIRAQVLTGAQRRGGLRGMEALVDQCLADYDMNGWTGETWINP